MSKFVNLGDLINRDRDPAKTAVIDLGGEDGPTEYCFAELDGMTMAVARALTKRGFARGDRIAIVSANRIEFLASYYGIMRAGFVAVPVNYRFPQKTIHQILDNAGAKMVFCDKASRVNCPDGLPVVEFSGERDDSFGNFIDPGEFTTVVPKDREPAMFLYTSGSTGLPKGVVLSHQSHIWVVETRLTPDLERHRYLIAAPLYHMNALALSKLACAAHATIVLLPKFEAKSYIEAIGQYRPTWLTAVPPMIAMMLRERDTMASTVLSSVEFIRMGSAPVSEALMAATHKAFPKAKVTNAYGTTEAGPVVFGPHPKGLPQPESSVGYPHPLVQLRLVDGDNRHWTVSFCVDAATDDILRGRATVSGDDVDSWEADVEYRRIDQGGNGDHVDRLIVDGVSQSWSHSEIDGSWWVAGPTGSWTLELARPILDEAADEKAGEITSPMPGTIVAVSVDDGDAVAVGGAELLVSDPLGTFGEVGPHVRGQRRFVVPVAQSGVDVAQGSGRDGVVEAD